MITKQKEKLHALLLEQNLDKVDWKYLSLNPRAIYILEKNLEKVDWRILSENPGIFKDNKKGLKDILIKCI